MASRSGRGAELLKILEEKKRAKAAEAKEIAECANKGEEHPQVVLANGRAALIEQLRKSAEAKAASAASVKVSNPLDIDSGIGFRSSDCISVSSRYLTGFNICCCLFFLNPLFCLLSVVSYIRKFSIRNKHSHKCITI